MTIASNIRVPGSYNEVDPSGANTALPAYRQVMQIVAPRIKAATAWVLETVTALGVVIKPTSGNDDGHYYICVAAGTTGSTEPTWPGASGSVTDGTVTWREYIDASDIIDAETPTRVFSADEVAAKAGRGSIAHRMARAAFRQYSNLELYINLVDDDQAGVKATATLAFAGTADGAGRADCYFGNDLVQTSWADGDTAAEIAVAFDAILAAKHDLPFSPNVATSTITLRAKNAGVPGNEIGKWSVANSKYEPVVVIYGSGITCTVTGFASGANNPDITDALTAAASGGFALVAMPYKDATNLAALETYMTDSSDEINCNGVRGFLALTDAIASATTLAGENDERLHVAIVRRCKYTSFEIAAEFAAMHSRIGHPGLPLNTKALVGCDAPDIADTLEFSEINALLWAGVTPFNHDGLGKVRCVRSITTYTVNASGSPDPFYLDTTTISCYDYSRKAIKTSDELQFSQAILRENHVDGEPSFIVTPEDIKSSHFLVCKKLERYGAMQQVDLYKDRFTAVRDPDVAGRVNSDIPVEVVQGLHVMANTLRAVTSTLV